jgi:hypothetical protein
MYDYELIPLEKLCSQPETQEAKGSGLGFLATLFLNMIAGLLTEPEDFGIEGEGKIETPQST